MLEKMFDKSYVPLTEKKKFWFIQNLLPPDVIAGFTKREVKGKNVKEGLAPLKQIFNCNLKFAHLRQFHSSQVRTVKHEGLYTGDGLFTDKPGLVLVVKTADCLPVFFWEDKTGTIGLVHLGWRSALGGILDNIKFAHREFKVLIGVGLRKCCFEVGKEFLDYERFSPFLEQRKGSIFFDPVSFLKKKLIKNGVDKNNFYDLGICSYCSNDFYSFRKEKTKKRTLSFIVKL